MEIINSCRICKSKNITPFFDLGKQPLANSLLKSANQKEQLYSLSLSYCRDCSLVQLNETVEPEVLFSQYVWVTATSKTANDFAEKFYKELVSRTANPKAGYVLEVASNDGTFLLPFLRDGFKVLGVDPAENIAEMAQALGVPTKCLFFGAESGAKIALEYGLAQMIFARNVLPHVANTRDFVEGLAACLHDEGTLAIEAHYAGKIMEELHYDSIYHEHLCYFTFKSMEKLLQDFNLHIFDIEESPISGGSLIFYAKKFRAEETEKVRRYRELESGKNTNQLENWQEFSRRAYAHREKFVAMLNEISAAGGTLAGYGSSARSSTLLNFCGIDSKLLPIIADQNPLKQGLYSAGTHIKIESPEKVMATNPKCAVILAWNFKDEIIEVLKNKFGWKGKVIVPLPGEPVMQEV